MTRVMNSGIDIYYTLSGPVKGVLKVQGSKFLSFATPVETPDMALSAWHSLQREYHDATHHCYAFRLQTADGEFRVNDDGEPAGTAGRQILQAIDRAELTNLVVVVVRYFGGTKLGVGGLSRAYCDAAGTAIQSGSIVQKFILESLRLTHPHHLTSPVMRTVEALGARIVESSYDDQVHLRLEIRASLAHRLVDALVEATNGGVVLEDQPRT